MVPSSCRAEFCGTPGIFVHEFAMSKRSKMSADSIHMILTGDRDDIFQAEEEKDDGKCLVLDF